MKVDLRYCKNSQNVILLLFFHFRCCITNMSWSVWEEDGKRLQGICWNTTPAGCSRSPVWMAKHLPSRANLQPLRTWIRIITWWSLPIIRLRRRLNESSWSLQGDFHNGLYPLLQCSQFSSHALKITLEKGVNRQKNVVIIEKRSESSTIYFDASVENDQLKEILNSDLN